MYTIEDLQKRINKEIEKRTAGLNIRKPAELYLPVSYSLEGGGKRLRPLLLLMSNNLFSEEPESVMPAAIATEVFHNFTLLHDDIMDKATVRRNKPTVHVKFNENKAILSGDAMAFLSYQYLMECRSEKLFEVVKLFTQTALEVCEGQQYDMDFEAREEVSETEYLEMIRLKTAVLLGCSSKAGALLANAPENVAGQLYEMGINLGLAFQVQDDWLDVYGSQKTFGKMIGGDILAGKKTYLLIKALEKAGKNSRDEIIERIKTSNYTAEEKISSVIRIYEELGVRELAEEKIMLFFTRATEILDNISVVGSSKLQFYNLIKSMKKRSQ